MKRRPRVPRHEPEVQEAIARREQASGVTCLPDTSLRKLAYKSVDLRSVSRRVDEYRLMMAAIDAIPSQELQHLSLVLCADEGDRYYLEFDGFLSQAEMRDALNRFEDIVFGLRKGHNGIEAIVDGLVHMGLDADWRA